MSLKFDDLRVTGGVKFSDDNRELINAAAAGDMDRMRRAKTQGASAVRTAFRAAARFGRVPCMCLIRVWGAGRNGHDVDDAMWLAAKHGHLEVMQLLIKWGADPNHRATFRATAEGGHEAALKLMWEWSKNHSYDRELMEIAASNGRVNLMMFLRRRGLSATHSMMMTAARGGHVSAMMLMVSWVDDLKYIDELKIVAAIHGRLQVIKLVHSWQNCYSDYETDSDDSDDDSGDDSDNDEMVGEPRERDVDALVAAARHGKKSAARLLIELDPRLNAIISDITEDHAWYELIDDTNLKKWQHEGARKKQYDALFAASLSLYSLRLPLYTELWILEWVTPGPLTEYERVALLNRARTAVTSLVDPA
jgi:hypothetical protein